MFAELAARPEDELKLSRHLTKAGSKHPIEWSESEAMAIENLKEAVVANLELYHINPSKPFVIRTDASEYAIGADFEQFPNLDGLRKVEDIKSGMSVPVAFMSRKLTDGELKKWDFRDKET